MVSRSLRTRRAISASSTHKMTGRIESGGKGLIWLHPLDETTILHAARELNRKVSLMPSMQLAPLPRLPFRHRDPSSEGTQLCDLRPCIPKSTNLVLPATQVQSKMRSSRTSGPSVRRIDVQIRVLRNRLVPSFDVGSFDRPKSAIGLTI